MAKSVIAGCWLGVINEYLLSILAWDHKWVEVFGRTEADFSSGLYVLGFSPLIALICNNRKTSDRAEVWAEKQPKTSRNFTR
jgi:hypothetical protein